MDSKFLKLCIGFINALGCILFFGLLVAQFLVLAHMPMDRMERMEFRINGPAFWVSLIAVCGVLFFSAGLLEKLKERTIFLTLSVVYIFASLFIIFNVPAELSDDAYMINYHAAKFFAGDYVGLTDAHYLEFFPYQLGMLTYELLLMRISHSIRLLFIMNMLFTLLSNFLLFRIAKRFFGSEHREALALKYTIVLSFAFLPMAFFVLFVYGFVPGLCCFEVSLLFLLKTIEARVRLKQVVYALISVVSMMFAVLMKPNYVIAILAVCIFIFLYCIYQKKALMFVMIVCYMVAAILGRELLYDYYRNISGIDFGSGAPFILNVAMGLQPEDEEHTRRGGWYNGYNYSTYESLNYDDESASKEGFRETKRLIGYWIKRPMEAARFFGIKIMSTWCDPLFESVYQGPLVEEGDIVNNPIMDSLYSGDYAYLFSEKIMNAITVIIYGGTFMYFFKRRGHITDCIFLLYFIGGFLYHLISETASRYSFIYVYCMIPYAAYSYAVMAKTLYIKRILPKTADCKAGERL